MWPWSILAIMCRPLGFISHKYFLNKIIRLCHLSNLSIPNQDYSRNAPHSLNLISTLLLLITYVTDTLILKYDSHARQVHFIWNIFPCIFHFLNIHYNPLHVMITFHKLFMSSTNTQKEQRRWQEMSWQCVFPRI